ncbi:hypothetical protein GOEFS_106_00080 [Gordonia effusa NBRC 100432]|uniref:Uncharacterized protein n=1 Tax=Gordonia effusa NBRC 100432 TaxID=1077974 RepID=H0R4W1_9ACTN|nr:hypothetical protein [Gordonia effusa]GAB20112.1 hypothetical protein GOEFS_106_00080 [Gordonia effusa NBRC 100432]
MGKRKRRRQAASQSLIAGKTPKHPVVIHSYPPDSLKARLFGLGLASTGAAHFTAPKAFDPLTAKAFPVKTRRWTYRNGLTELALGLAITSRHTRPLGTVGLAAYTAFLAGRHNKAANTPPTPPAVEVSTTAPETTFNEIDQEQTGVAT